MRVAVIPCFAQENVITAIDLVLLLSCSLHTRLTNGMKNKMSAVQVERLLCRLAVSLKRFLSHYNYSRLAQSLSVVRSIESDFCINNTCLNCVEGTEPAECVNPINRQHGFGFTDLAFLKNHSTVVEEDCSEWQEVDASSLVLDTEK